MRDLSPAMIIGTVFGVGLWLTGLWLNLSYACPAYRVSPDVANFGLGASTFAFLFSSTLVGAAFGVIALSLNADWLDGSLRFRAMSPLPTRAIFAGMVAFMCVLQTSSRAGQALAVAARMHASAFAHTGVFAKVVCAPFF